MNRFLLVFLSLRFSLLGFSSPQIDSLLKRIQESVFNANDKKTDFDLPYNDIVNNLNKCLVIFQKLH